MKKKSKESVAEQRSKAQHEELCRFLRGGLHSCAHSDDPESKAALRDVKNKSVAELLEWTIRCFDDQEDFFPEIDESELVPGLLRALESNDAVLRAQACVVLGDILNNFKDCYGLFVEHSETIMWAWGILDCFPEKQVLDLLDDNVPLVQQRAAELFGPLVDIQGLLNERSLKTLKKRLPDMCALQARVPTLLRMVHGAAAKAAAAALVALSKIDEEAART